MTWEPASEDLVRLARHRRTMTSNWLGEMPGEDGFRRSSIAQIIGSKSATGGPHTGAAVFPAIRQTGAPFS